MQGARPERSRFEAYPHGRAATNSSPALPGRLQLRPAIEEGAGDPPRRAHLRELDGTAPPLHPGSEAPHPGTEHPCVV